MIDIERRLKLDIISYCFSDKKYFESFLNYTPNTSHSYLVLVKELIGSDWNIENRGIWYQCFPNKNRLIPEQGFKIHLSATSITAQELIKKVVPILNEHNITFKIIVDQKALDFINSKTFSRSSSGKFITLYFVSDDEFLMLSKLLYQATFGMDGPYILTDKRYLDSKIVFYRYGGYGKKFLLNVYGEKSLVLRNPNGDVVIDDRTPRFRLPSWVIDPKECSLSKENNVLKQNQVLLNNRFAIEKAIQFSNSGGVYVGKDTHTGKKIIIKEARPLVNISAENREDAIAVLKREFHILKLLEDTNYTPKPLAYISEWEHNFLVEEFIDGTLFSTYRAMDEVAILTNKSINENTIHLFLYRFFTIGKNLIKAIKSFHKLGIIVGDMSPSNIFIDPNTLDIRIIDFEGAFILGSVESDNTRSVITMGYASKCRQENNRPPSIEDDYYSLGCILYSFIYPVQEFINLHPASKYLFIDEINKDFGFPSWVGDGIKSLLEGDIDKSYKIFHDTHRIEDITFKPFQQLNRSNIELNRICDGITKNILKMATCSRKDRLWPADYRVFTTNPLNIGFGAMGIIMYLKQVQAKIPKEIENWIVNKEFDSMTYPPGMYVGLSGIAYCFSEMGMMIKAEKAMENAYESPLLYDSPDLFFGVAGWGWGSLCLYVRTKNSYFLNKACQAGDFLLKTAKRENGYCSWSNADGVIYYSVAHGASGIALFLLYLYQYTKCEAYLDDAISGMNFELSKGVVTDDYIIWPRSPDSNLLLPYWRFGNAGIGSALIRFSVLLDDVRFSKYAALAANYAVTKYSVYPGQFGGMSGIGEFMLDMYIFTKENIYLKYAHQLTNLLNFSIEEDTGIAFPGEKLIRLTCDYGTGSAGVGIFLNRLSNPSQRLFYDFDPELFSGKILI